MLRFQQLSTRFIAVLGHFRRCELIPQSGLFYHHFHRQGRSLRLSLELLLRPFVICRRSLLLGRRQ